MSVPALARRQVSTVSRAHSDRPKRDACIAVPKAFSELHHRLSLVSQASRVNIPTTACVMDPHRNKSGKYSDEAVYDQHHHANARRRPTSGPRYPKNEGVAVDKRRACATSSRRSDIRGRSERQQRVGGKAIQMCQCTKFRSDVSVGVLCRGVTHEQSVCVAESLGRYEQRENGESVQDGEGGGCRRTV